MAEVQQVELGSDDEVGSTDSARKCCNITKLLRRHAAMHAPGKTEGKVGGKGSQVKEITEQEPAEMKKITAEDENWSEKPADEGSPKGRLECQRLGGAAAEVGGRTSCVCSLEPKRLRIHRVSTHMSG